MLKVSAVIMASGNSSRMGTNKLFLNYQGQTFLQHALQLTQQLDVYERILVLSPENAQDLHLPEDVTLVINQQAHLGQSASVRLGTRQASGDGYLYLTVDQPLLTPALFTPVFAAYATERIVFPINESGDPCSPIFFGKKFRSELLAVTGATGGRSVRQRHPEAWRGISVKEPERLVDIDTPFAYQKLLKKIN
jgi:molybdenum cofactor cytidylyltransferase